jgi:HK97 family phage portal protein
LFGFEITRTRAQSLTSLSNPWRWMGPYWGNIQEPSTGAWQRNLSLSTDYPTLLQSSAVWMCVDGISSDIAKMRFRFSEENSNGIWEEVEEPSPFKAVLKTPNHYQNEIEFKESWMLSKLLHGNTYVLKEREPVRGLVRAMYVLNPQLVTPLQADDGSVFYDLRRDPLSQLEDQMIVPASEIIHDKYKPIWHPLIGVSPLYACAHAATMQTSIQNNSTNLFSNRSMPGGQLTAPGHISDEIAQRLKQMFETNFSGPNYGRLFVSGDGLKFEPIQLTAEQSQLAEQMGLTVLDIGRAFHYPLFWLTGDMPPYAGGPDAISTHYYSNCLQIHVTKMEEALDKGLELPPGKHVELELDDLLRMDTSALFKSNNDGVGGGWMKPNEARFRANMDTVEGGDSPYLQEQNFSLAALAKRDAQEDPFASKSAAATPAPAEEPEEEEVPARRIETTTARSFSQAEMRVFYRALLKERCEIANDRT